MSWRCSGTPREASSRTRSRTICFRPLSAQRANGAHATRDAFLSLCLHSGPVVPYRNFMAEKGVILSLEGRVAVVTGGSRGIGAAIVRLFSRAGARVVFSYQKAGKEAED